LKNVEVKKIHLPNTVVLSGLPLFKLAGVTLIIEFIQE